MLQPQTIFDFAIDLGQLHLASGAKIGLPDIQLVLITYVNSICQVRCVVADSDFRAEGGDLELMVLDQNQQMKPEQEVLSWLSILLLL